MAQIGEKAKSIEIQERMVFQQELMLEIVAFWIRDAEPYSPLSIAERLIKSISSVKFVNDLCRRVFGSVMYELVWMIMAEAMTRFPPTDYRPCGLFLVCNHSHCKTFPSSQRLSAIMSSLHSVSLRLRCSSRFGLPYWRQVQCDLFADRLEIRSSPSFGLLKPIHYVLPIIKIRLSTVIGRKMEIGSADNMSFSICSRHRIDVIRLWNRMDCIQKQIRRGAPVWIPDVADQQLWCKTGIFH